MTSAALAELNSRTFDRPRALPLLVAAAVLALTSCSAAPDPGSDGAGDTGASAVATALQENTDGPVSSAPFPGANADAAAIAVAVEAALRTLAGTGSVTSDQVRTAIEQGFADAGSAPDTVEVSIDRTPTGLDVDAIQGAGRTGGTCIVGEVREGAVAVTVLPVLATGLCFVGDQR